MWCLYVDAAQSVSSYRERNTNDHTGKGTWLRYFLLYWLVTCISYYSVDSTAYHYHRSSYSCISSRLIVFPLCCEAAATAIIREISVITTAIFSFAA